MRHLSLFTGSGIGDYAAEQCGIETVGQCESDPVCLYWLRKRWPNVPKIEDVRNVTAVELDRLGILPVDLISGGFPCQDISTAGKGAGIHGEQSGLWFEMRRVIGEVRPPWVLIENVPALRSRGADRVLADLEAEGYTCEAVVVGAWAVGAPHKRDRVWIVGRLEHAPQSGIGRVDSRPVRTGEEGAARRGDGHVDQRNEDMGNSESGGAPAAEQPERLREPEQASETAADAGYRHNGIDGCSEPGGCAVARWPARPGELQHEWEAPRLTQRGVGCAVDELSTRVHTRANKSMLRILGNAWVYPLAQIIYQWIAEQGAQDGQVQ